MSKLDIYAPRPYHVLEIAMEKGIKKTFKIPSELTIGEVERLLETQSKLDKLQDEQATDGGTAQLRLYWGYIYAQLEIIFRHYQPEVDADYLRENLLPKDAIAILNFFAENRYIDKEENSDDKSEVKKKSSLELVNLRRSVVFLVKRGFGLRDIKTLYLDEFRDYYNETVYLMEQSGEIKEGQYEKLKGEDKTQESINNFISMFKQTT